MASSTSSEKIWYEASCHCSAVRYKALVPDLKSNSVHNCNCSICTKNGHLSAVVPRKDVIFHQGYEKLKDYQFATGKVTHKFCEICGSSVLVDLNQNLPGMGDSLGLNVRMFKDVDLDKLELKKFDGKNLLNPEYNT